MTAPAAAVPVRLRPRAWTANPANRHAVRGAYRAGAAVAAIAVRPARPPAPDGKTRDPMPAADTGTKPKTSNPIDENRCQPRCRGSREATPPARGRP